MRDNRKGSSGRRSARDAALGLLARREHGSKELSSKLQAKGFDAAEAGNVVADLSEAGLVSDRRFVSAFISYHAGRGQGPVRISAELRQRGVPAELIAAELAAAEVDWSEIAAGVRHRKFSAVAPKSFAERAKQVRFLQYRGFSSDHIRAMWNDLETARDVSLTSGDDLEPPAEDFE